jgi:hypothetical protein
MTKRLACILIAIAAGACVYAPAASAYFSSNPFVEATATSATFGGNTLTLTAHRDFVPSGSAATGSFSLSGTDAKGTHSLSGPVDRIEAFGDDAGVLAHQTSSSGEPASVYGVLFHVTDAEPQGTNDGAGDKLDVTMLNQKQWQRAMSTGSVPQTGKQSLSAGNLTVDSGQLIINLCPPLCGPPL